jgi:hypothetical protein
MDEWRKINTAGSPGCQDWKGLTVCMGCAALEALDANGLHVPERDAMTSGNATFGNAGFGLIYSRRNEYSAVARDAGCPSCIHGFPFTIIQQFEVMESRVLVPVATPVIKNIRQHCHHH